MTDHAPIRVVSGSPTDEETAAVAALFAQLLLERAAMTAPLPAEARPSAWTRPGRRDGWAAWSSADTPFR